MDRRLIARGVRFVQIWSGNDNSFPRRNWDSHEDIERDHAPLALGMARGAAGLIQDLKQRGLLDDTLVSTMSEFGRTPKVNPAGGRDHWPHAMSVLVAGAGVPPGQIIGATDVKGYYASENIYSPEDFACSLYTKMGIDPHKILYTNTGRPLPIVNGGAPIKELLG
mgnify:CR=1 FL=1